jgi:hypothetical protein
MTDEQRPTRWSRAGALRDESDLDLDTTLREVAARLRTAREMVSSAQEQLAEVRSLHREMRAAKVQTVGELSDDSRALHRSAISSAVGKFGGVEMW